MSSAIKHMVIRPDGTPYTALFTHVVDALNSAVKLQKKPWPVMKDIGFRLAKVEIMEHDMIHKGGNRG